MYNTGQSAVTIRDLKGREYPAVAEVNRKRRVNGQREISLSFLYTEINQEFMNKLEFGWKVLFGGEWYTITHPGYSTDGDYFAINVTAILSFFVDLNGYYLQDKVENKSMTPANFFTELFAGTPYNYVLSGSFTANTLSYEDNQSKTERFLYGVDRFAMEYKVVGSLAYLHNLVGSDKDVILHEDLNVQSVSIDVDASGFHTWAKGYGDLPENTENADYRLKVEYRSPLIAKFGEIEGPAVKDGNYTHADSLTEAVKNQVENSYIVSTQVDAVDLTNNGYPEMVLEEGDRVWLYVSKLNLNQQVRVVEIDETFDWEGNLIDVKYTLGNEGIAERYKTQQYDSIKDFNDFLAGKKKMPYNWFPDSIKRAADIINGNLESHFKYGAGEIIGINKTNPNGYMRFNTDGIGFSRDGGKTYKSAVTHEGVVAESIIGQNIIGVNLTSPNEEGYFHVNGANAEFYNNLSKRKVQISADGIYGYNSNGSTQFRADELLVTSSALGTTKNNVYLAAQSNKEGRVVDITQIPSDGEVESYTYLPFRAQGFYGNFIENNRGVTGNNLYLRPRLNGEVRVTAAGTTDIYYPLRAANIYGTAFTTTTNNAYVGADGELRVVNKGFVEGSSGSPIYRDIRAGYLWTTGLVSSTSGNLYAGTDDELRVTSRAGFNGGSPIYRQVKALGYLGQHLTSDPDLFAYVGTDLGLRVTSRGLANAGPIYRDVYAANFVNGSLEEYKTNIQLWEGNALEKILNSDIYTYHLKSENQSVNVKQQYGLVIGPNYRTPPEVIHNDGIEQYVMNTFSWKAIQQMYKHFTDKINLLEQEIAKLKTA